VELANDALVFAADLTPNAVPMVTTAAVAARMKQVFLFIRSLLLLKCCLQSAFVLQNVNSLVYGGSSVVTGQAWWELGAPEAGNGLQQMKFSRKVTVRRIVECFV
jgi:hypothetical protein